MVYYIQSKSTRARSNIVLSVLEHTGCKGNLKLDENVPADISLPNDLRNSVQHYAFL